MTGFFDALGLLAFCEEDVSEGDFSIAGDSAGDVPSDCLSCNISSLCSMTGDLTAADLTDVDGPPRAGNSSTESKWMLGLGLGLGVGAVCDVCPFA